MRNEIPNIHLAGSKSITQRAIIAASLAQGESIIQNPSKSDDTKLLIAVLSKLGVRFEYNNKDVHVFSPRTLTAIDGRLNFDNAGTSLRFCLPLIAFTPGSLATIDGSARMRERPLKTLLEKLRALGADIKGKNSTDELPLIVKGTSATQTLAVNFLASESSQFISALLLASSLFSTGGTINFEPTQPSWPYIQMTLDVLKAFGFQGVLDGKTCVRIPAHSTLAATNFHIEADASSAANFLIYALLNKTPLTVLGLKADSIQGDMALIALLKQLAVDYEFSASGLTIFGCKQINAFDFSVKDCPDLAPTLAILAATIADTSIIRDTASLAFKESDRGLVLARELAKLGVNVQYSANELKILGPVRNAALIQTADDHRIAMAFAILGSIVPGIELDNKSCVTKSCPEFWQELSKLQ